MADIYGVGTEERQRFIEETAKRFEMEENLSSRIMSYSHGMRQKIMVMGALIHKPPVWILDEPLTGLDLRSAHELKQMMREHADAGNAVLFSTHVLEVAEKLCDRIAIIHHGRQVYLGTLEELKAAYPDQINLKISFWRSPNMRNFMDSHPFPSEKRTRKSNQKSGKRKHFRTEDVSLYTFCLVSALPVSVLLFLLGYSGYTFLQPLGLETLLIEFVCAIGMMVIFLLWPAAVSERVLHGL